MEKLAALLKVLLFSNFLYLIVGLPIHSKIVGRPPTPNYYHNIAVGVVIVSLIVVYLGLIIVLRYQPHLIQRDFSSYVTLTIVTVLVGFLLTTGANGGSFVGPAIYAGLVMPGSLVILGIIYQVAVNKARD
ncbi:MAG: hypothetical protein V5A57_02575 [Candidatus Paceibacterota bacterium]